ncbi:anthranilate synthase component II [Youngiibacter fragilis]|uniref:anthranilate synthase component II n=1 Tax=Youngiibacter fragilis TaxID=1408819 RepID=UPI000428E570|nr:aminodeoxychorismate/anthranilate synthase component II [Youngiibacter fragilis]
MILMIDNYDSFVYNLVRYLEELDACVSVFRNDKLNIEDVEAMDPEAIVISPGPKSPEQAGICLEVIKRFSGRIPILGICLGYQCIAHSFGASIIRGNEPMHGKISSVVHDNKGMFADIRNPVEVTRYHSLIVDEDSLPTCFEVTARTTDGVIMGIRHKEFLLEGVQFHPEAELTECGHEMLRNFIEEAKSFNRRRHNETID